MNARIGGRFRHEIGSIRSVRAGLYPGVGPFFPVDGKVKVSVSERAAYPRNTPIATDVISAAANRPPFDRTFISLRTPSACRRPAGRQPRLDHVLGAAACAGAWQSRPARAE